MRPTGEERGPQPGQRRPQGPGMMPEGPWNQNLRQAVLGVNGKVESQGFFLQSGGVAHLVQDAKGRLIAVFQWFPQGERELFDQVALSISSDGGKAWTTPRKIIIAGLPESMRRPYDPTLAVVDEGRLRLYFTSHEQPADSQPSAIYSALSTDGGDSWTFEPGKRFAVEGAQLQDCAVVRLAGTWHLLCPLPRGAGAMHATSADGLTFSSGDKIAPEPGWSWIGNLTATGDKLHFWVGARDSILRLESSDGVKWSNSAEISLRGMDPGVLPLPDGRTLLIYTGPPAMHQPRPGYPQPGGPAAPPPREPDVELKRDPPPAK